MKARRAPSRHSNDARVYGHTTTAMHKLRIHPLLPPLTAASGPVILLPLEGDEKRGAAPCTAKMFLSVTEFTTEPGVTAAVAGVISADDARTAPKVRMCRFRTMTYNERPLWNVLEGGEKNRSKKSGQPAVAHPPTHPPTPSFWNLRGKNMSEHVGKKK